MSKLHLNKLNELLNWIEENRSSNMYYRCYSRDCERISSLGRTDKGKKWKASEFQLYRDFAYILLEELDEKLTFIEILEIGQHFGLPTRFIDFTIDPYIALFFGYGNGINKGSFKLCYMSEKDKLVKIGLNSTKHRIEDFYNYTIDNIGMLTQEEKFELSQNLPLRREYLFTPLLEDCFSKFFEVIQDEHTVIAFDPNKLNTRQLAQKGLFVCMSNPEVYLTDKLYNEISVNLNSRDICKLKKLLQEKKLTSENLFPKCINGINVERIVLDMQIKYCSCCAE